MGRKRDQGNKQVLRQLNNDKYFRLMQQRGEIPAQFIGSPKLNMSKLAAILETQGYAVEGQEKP